MTTSAMPRTAKALDGLLPNSYLEHRLTATCEMLERELAQKEIDYLRNVLESARYASGSSKEMEELQALAGELRDTSKWRVSSAQRTILLNAADAVAALWHIKSADAIASRSATGRGTDG